MGTSGLGQPTIPKKVVGLGEDNSKVKVTPPEVFKKITNLNKKLHEVKQLKTKMEQGYFLNANQIEKIKKEEDFKTELKNLETEYKING